MRWDWVNVIERAGKHILTVDVMTWKEIVPSNFDDFCFNYERLVVSFIPHMTPKWFMRNPANTEYPYVRTSSSYWSVIVESRIDNDIFLSITLHLPICVLIQNLRL